MINAFFTAKSGMRSSQQSLDVVANNIANVNTAGYKTQRSAFTDLLYQNIRLGAGAGQMLVGSGAKIASVIKDNSVGSYEQTGNLLDFSIMGEGYFAVSNGIIIDNPEYLQAMANPALAADINIEEIPPRIVSSNAETMSYTRVGNFTSSTIEGQKYLVTQNGEFVLDDKLQPIVLDGDIRNILFLAPQSPVEDETENIDANINVNILQPENVDIAETEKQEPVFIGIFSFQNPQSLSLEGNGKYVADEAAGEALVLYNASISQQSLEKSNVNITDEMKQMIMSQRAYQLSAKLIQTADELEQLANTLRN